MTITYTHPDTFTIGVAEGWAEAETDPTRIDWAGQQAAAAIPFDVVNGRPVNPCEKTRVQRGRNGLGLWGENLMADAVVTCRDSAGRRRLLMVERRDGHGWAVPGGAVEPGETPLAAAARELAEETHLTALASKWTPGEAVYVPDPRASDEAWAVTVPAHADLGTFGRLPDVIADDDAARAEWVRAGSYQELAHDLADRFAGRVFPAHVDMLTALLDTGHERG